MFDERYDDEWNELPINDFDEDLTELFDSQRRFNHSLEQYGVELDSLTEGLVM